MAIIFGVVRMGKSGSDLGRMLGDEEASSMRPEGLWSTGSFCVSPLLQCPFYHQDSVLDACIHMRFVQPISNNNA